MPNRQTREDTPVALNYNELLVLQALGSGCRYGLEVVTLTRLSAGTVYPILRRLESREYTTTREEDEEAAHAEGRPARRLHEVTPAGRIVLARAREEFHALHARLGLVPPVS